MKPLCVLEKYHYKVFSPNSVRSLIKQFGIPTAENGLIYTSDDTLIYWIKRFDRIVKRQKLSVEDFAQLTGQKRTTKYYSSIEKLIYCIEEYCTFPVLEKLNFFRRFLFNFIIGNEDMHLKNYSLITINSVTH